MTAKMTIDDLFEKDEQVDAARLVRLQRWEGWLRVALGLAIACLLFTPNLLNDSAKHFILTFTLWLVPFGFSLFLLFWPSWRPSPSAAVGHASSSHWPFLLSPSACCLRPRW